MRYDVSMLDETYSRDDFVFFWSHKPAKGGEITESCLSQWWGCDFVENRIIFCCAEQYMMYHKALVFQDYEYAAMIIRSHDPKEIKEMGRAIRNFDDKLWNDNKRRIVLQGNILKFSQNQELRDYLIGTGSKILVEASPYDRIWGIGMRQDAEGICDPSQWKGTNLLGFSLMDVRDRIGFGD